MQTTFIVVVVVVLLFSAIVNIDAQCSQAVDAQNVCLYGTTSLNGVGGNTLQQNCQTVNGNPFAYPNGGTSCESAVRSDGSACIEFYSKYMCSALCVKCNLSPCNYFCDNHQSICPTATSHNCFQGIACDNEFPPTCVNWDVDVSKIPNTPITTTTTTTTRQSTTSGATTTTAHNSGSTSTTTSEDFTSSAYSIASSSSIMLIGFIATFYFMN